MKCLRCGKESPNDVKFCPDCGYQFIQPQSVPYNNTSNVQQPKKKHGCLTAILICIGVFFGIGMLMVIYDALHGDSGDKSSKKSGSSYELYELRDASEDDVCKYFGVEKSEMGDYPSEDCILVYCMEGKVFLLKLSNNDTKYQLCGIKMGDSADSAKDAIKDDFTEDSTAPISEATRTIYKDNKHDGYFLMLDVDSNNKIVGVSYGPSDDVIFGGEGDEEETDDSPKSENKEFDSEDLKYISQCENIPYDNLARKPDDYTGKNVMFYGQISQVLQEDNMYEYRVLIDENGDNDGFVFYELPDGKERILENDLVCVFASFEGLMTYETTRGDERTVPKYNASIVENAGDLPIAGTELVDMYGEFTSDDGGKIIIDNDEEGEFTLELIEDGKTVIQTYPVRIMGSSDAILCINSANELDLVFTTDSENKEIDIIAGLDSKYSGKFTFDKETSKKDKKDDKEDSKEEDSSGSEFVDKAVAILERATQDALDDGDIVYMTAVDHAKSSGGTYVIDFDMTIFTDPYRNDFEDQLVGKINDEERVTIDYALRESDIKINIKEDGTFTVTKTLYVAEDKGPDISTEYYFIDSDSRYLTEDDLAGLSKDDLAYARNEIYARHGYIFQEAMFSNYFKTRTWYVPKYTGAEFDDSVFNEYERKNIEFIKSHE